MSSKEELSQFVDKFTKGPKQEAAPAREVEAKPGASRPLPADRKVPDLNPNIQVSTETIRGRGSVAQDNLRNNTEGVRFVPPPELRSRFDAYRGSLARPRSKGSSRQPGAAAPAPGATR